MVPSNLKVLAKFGLCSNCWKNYMSARLRKHNLHLENKSAGTGNNVSCMGTLEKYVRTMNVSGKMLPHFVVVFVVLSCAFLQNDSHGHGNALMMSSLVLLIMKK